MTDDNQLSFNLPSVSRKKVTAAFDGGRLSSDAAVIFARIRLSNERPSKKDAACISRQSQPEPSNQMSQILS
jgi:hypothetical protein